MMKKRLTSFALALSIAASAVISVSAYAVPQRETWNADFVPEEFTDCVKLEDYEFLLPNDPLSGKYNVAMYMKYYGYSKSTLYNVYWLPDEIHITTLDESLVDKITAKTESVGGNLMCSGHSTNVKNGVTKTYLTFYSKAPEGGLTSIDMDVAAAFFELIKDDVEEYTLSSDIYLCQTGYCHGLTTYSLGDVQQKIQDIQDFIDSEKIEAKIVVNENENKLYIIPNDDISSEEHYKLMQKLYNEFGIRCMAGWLESTGTDLKMGGTIDMKNVVKGDANDDSEITIADATAILQALGNPDKYALSVQGKYNADVDGKAGITASDAITIQQYEAKLIKKLPAE